MHLLQVTSCQLFLISSLFIVHLQRRRRRRMSQKRISLMHLLKEQEGKGQPIISRLLNKELLKKIHSRKN
jgi:hypothetical protein